MLGPTLRGEKIVLTAARPEDLPTFCAWFANPEATRYTLMSFPFSLQQEEEWFDRAARSESMVHWRIAVEDRTIGVTSLEEIDWRNRHCGSGTLIGDVTQWGKGYGTEAVKLRTAFAFQDLGLERLESSSLVENIGMHRALERSGYRKIGRRRRYIYRGGAWHDSFIFELLREEWLALENKGASSEV